jgi:hypothetical protein
MELLTDEIRDRLPKLYETEKDKDPMLQVKYFAPWTNWSWCATYAELGITPVMRSPGLCGVPGSAAQSWQGFARMRSAAMAARSA